MSVPGLFAGTNRLVICLGPGGVGKTTISAAIAVGAAVRGRAVDVMTVDPAPRLLDALGLEAGDAAIHAVSLDGIDSVQGARLRALKLDPKATFDALVKRYAPSKAARAAILQNRIYRNLSSALAGVADYMAMEKLVELHADRNTELVVLDTPPAREALDFLDAPRRLLDLLSSRALTLLGVSRDFIRASLVDLAARAVLRAFDRLTGLHLLADVQAFARSFEGMYDGFAERARRAHDIVRDKRTFVVVVTTAEAERAAETRLFVDSLRAAGIRIDALVVNRLMPPMPHLSEVKQAKIAPELRHKLERNWHDYAALRRRQSISLRALRSAVGARTRLIVAPDLGREPRSLADLAAIGKGLRAG